MLGNFIAAGQVQRAIGIVHHAGPGGRRAGQIGLARFLQEGGGDRAGQAAEVGGDIGQHVAQTQVGGVDAIEAADDGVVVAHGIGKRVQAGGGQLVRSVMRTGQHRTEASCQAQEGVALVAPTDCSRAVVQANALFELPNRSQAATQVFGTFQADAGSVAVKTPSMVTRTAPEEVWREWHRRPDT